MQHMIHWHEVASHAPVQRLAEIIRRQFNIWSGFIERTGAATTVGTGQPVEKALCVALMGRADGVGSCQRSLRQWIDTLAQDATKVGSDGPQLVTCHAGLSALIVPIITNGRVVGGCYASGFLVEDNDTEVQRRARSLDLGLALVRQGSRQIPRILGKELDIIGDLCQAMADEALRLINAPKPEHPQTLEAPDRPFTSEITGESAAMQRLYEMIRKVSRGNSTILITGEPGTGKELVARAIHLNSPRRDEAFIAQNCSAMNDNLLDSELFGHKKGAFTGSISDKPGLFALADQGTFFLDEVGDMTAALQVKLLRVLEEGTFQAVGDTVTRKVDVRVIAATHRDLSKLIQSGQFRQDLYFRLNVISIHIPPLRERKEDIPALVNRFLVEQAKAHNRGVKRLSPQALAALMAYPWPGNVRELENEIERLVVLSGDDITIADDLLSSRIITAAPQAPTQTPPAPPAPAPPPTLSPVDISALPPKMPAAVEALERHMMLTALRATGWNKSQAARLLGVSRRNLIRKVDRFQLKPAPDEPIDNSDDTDEEPSADTPSDPTAP